MGILCSAQNIAADHHGVCTRVQDSCLNTRSGLAKTTLSQLRLGDSGSSTLRKRSRCHKPLHRREIDIFTRESASVNVDGVCCSFLATNPYTYSDCGRQ